MRGSAGLSVAPIEEHIYRRQVLFVSHSGSTYVCLFVRGNDDGTIFFGIKRGRVVVSTRKVSRLKKKRFSLEMGIFI